MAWLHRLDRWIFGLVDKLVILLVGIITVAVIATVFSRFVLNNSFSWGEELPGLLLVSLTFLGSAWLARYDQHLAFDGLVLMMPPRLQFVVRIINLVLVEIFLVCLTYFGWVVVESTGSTSLVTLRFPLAFFRAMVPIGGMLMMLGYGVQIGKLISRGSRGETGGDHFRVGLPVDEDERVLSQVQVASTETSQDLLSSGKEEI